MKEEYESKGEEVEFTVQTSGEFQCPPRHSGALFGAFAGWRVKRAAASARHIHSGGFLLSLKGLSKVCLFKRGWTQLKPFTKYHHRFRVLLLRWLVRIKLTSGLLFVLFKINLNTFKYLTDSRLSGNISEFYFKFKAWHSLKECPSSPFAFRPGVGNISFLRYSINQSVS